MKAFNRKWISTEDFNSGEEIINEETGEPIRDAAVELTEAQENHQEEQAELDQEDKAITAVRDTQNLTNFVERKAQEKPLTEAEVVLFKNNVATNLSNADAPEEVIKEAVLSTSNESFVSNPEIALEAVHSSLAKMSVDLRDSIRDMFNRNKQGLSKLWNNSASMRKLANELREELKGYTSKVKEGVDALPEGSEDYLLADTRTMKFNSKGLIPNFKKSMIRTTANLTFPTDFIVTVVKNVEDIFTDINLGRKNPSLDLEKITDTINKMLSSEKATTQSKEGIKFSVLPLAYGNQAVHAKFRESDNVEEQLFSFDVRLDNFHPKNNVVNTSDKQPIPSMDELKQIPDIIDDLAANIEKWTDNSSRQSWNSLNILVDKLNKLDPTAKTMAGQGAITKIQLMNRRLPFLCRREILLASAVALHAVKCGRALVNFGKRAAKCYEKQ